jgi:RND family efflux transporter MFP subunit
MTQRSGLLTGLVIGVLATGVAAAVWNWSGPKKEEKPKAESPATIAKTLKEDDLNTIVLSDSAMQRLAIKVAAVKSEPVARSRVYGGEVVVKPGQSVVVSAPISGTLKLSGDQFPQPGEAVKAGQPLFELLPVLTPEGRATLTTALVDASGLAKNTATQVAALQIALERARRVFQSEAGSKRAVDEAQAAYDVAQQTLAAAQARQASLEAIVGDAAQGKAGPLTIDCPHDGLLRTISAAPGQIVPAGSPLLEIVNLDRVWIRVPVFAGEEEVIESDAAASVSSLGASGKQAADQAEFAAAPPSANSLTGTIDFYYELANPKHRYRPGERVAARLTLLGEQQGNVIAWSAVIFDIYGGTWVYEQTAEKTFVRRRVVVSHVDADVAILSSGPQPGAKIVTAGAAELFGTETGFTK